ncbi:EboA domain-containing protein [Chryseobacterium sp. ES2]|uniref:EboA domain-containing protein n=1 Tax=Chryseobacterium metallicongregator TaxID=3073042 RepID=A0ABU1DZN6_9FLAO|nr:EboA domain-containing protein [Chryseobacterium sp. ES2]MDR4950991.1 EboA domain-containing protein [Chryseobacterium sp. ES2]
MTENIIKNNSCEALYSLIQTRLSEDQMDWMKTVMLFENENLFFQNFGRISRMIPSTSLQWSPSEKIVLEQLYPGLTSGQWNLQQICRCLLMVYIPEDQNVAIIQQLTQSADIGELICIYKGVFFLENAFEFVPLVEEGIRTNITSVFDAIALLNPFAAKYLSLNSWNQLVLKTLFMGRPLYQITNLDLRKNEMLAFIATDFVHERWAAGRTVSPEIWRLMDGFVNKEITSDLLKVIEAGDPLSKHAAIIVLRENASNTCNNILRPINTTLWNYIGEQYYIQINK